MGAQAQPVQTATKAGVATKAVLRAAERLDLTNRALARVLGVSEASVSRMRSGAYLLEPDQKAFELAVLFARLYRSLDAIVGGDDAVARSWLRNANTALGGIPAEQIQTITGLTHVLQYLDARRAVV